MRKGLLGVLSLGLVLAAAALSAQLGGRREEDEATRHGWLSSLAEAKAQARRSGKPIMAVVRCVP
jgi:hypothetical protein